jgi:hypothetical protein
VGAFKKIGDWKYSAGKDSKRSIPPTTMLGNLSRSLGGRRFVTVATVCGLLMTGVTFAAASSASADAAVAISPGQDNCVDYSQGVLWQTSTSWARVRYQPCLQESSDGSTVKPIIRVQFDWPAKNGCSLSVGFPPSAGVSCPLAILAKPGHTITFQAYTSHNFQPVDFEIPLEITRPNGQTYSGWCYYHPKDTSTNTSTYNIFQNGGRSTLTCNGPTFKRLIGTYTVGSLGPRGDVENDGADARILTAGQMQFVSS